MWPMLLDMSRDDCKRFLRRLELVAYGNIVSAFRAQGELSDEKRTLLQDLSSTLNISMERHKAEVRRAVNDEKLATVAEQMCGPNTMTDWAIEGRRLVPLLPRLVPQTAFTALANNVANIAAAENALLPPPAQTAKIKESVVGHGLPPQNEPGIPEATKTPQQSSSPVPSNVMQLPPGTSIQLKKEPEDDLSRKRRKSVSFEDPLPIKMPTVSHAVPSRRILSYPGNLNPVKITPCRPAPTVQSPATQKVIIVSSTATPGSSSVSSSILQRSLSGVPIVKTVTSTSSSTTICQKRPLHNIATTLHQQSTSVANIVTISTNPCTSGLLTPTTGKVSPSSPFVTATCALPKIRPMTLHLPGKSRGRSGSIVIPTTHNTLATVQKAPLQQAIKPSHMQVKPEQLGNTPYVKTITSTTAKILPKPVITAAGSSPMYVMSTTPSSSVPVTRTVPSTLSPRVITTPKIHSVPIGAKSVQKIKIGSGSKGLRPIGGKTNVIVVQKGATSGYARGVTLAHGGKEITTKKVAVSKTTVTNRSQSVATVTVKRPNSSAVQIPAKPQTIQLPGNTMPGSVIVLDLSQEHFTKNTVLADILQASGILMDSTGEQEQNIKAVGSSSQDTESIELMESDTAQYYQQLHETNKQDLRDAEVNSTDNSGQSANEQQPILVEEGGIVTLEEAVALLGHSDCPETRALLSRAGIEVTDQHSYGAPDSMHSSIHQVVHEEDVISAETDIMEVIGELDPQTGIYSIHSAVASGSNETIEVQSDKTPQTPANMDIYSTALASADINLDSFQYIDDNLGQLPAHAETDSDIQEYSTYNEAGMDVVVESEPIHVEESIVRDGQSEHQYSTFIEASNTLDTGHENTAVMVEPSNMDTTEMYIEDFSSQKM